MMCALSNARSAIPASVFRSLSKRDFSAGLEPTSTLEISALSGFRMPMCRTASIMGAVFYAWKAPAGLVQCLISSRSARPSSEAILLTFGGEPLVAASPPPERRSLTPVPDDHSPEPHAVVTDAEKEMPLPSDPRTFFLGGLFALGFLAALYVASSIILPVVLAFVFYPAPSKRS
jgi:hypothetical protein